jgi:hypothetical protein
MPSLNHSPAYLRYLKARLKPFGRPAFWTSAIALLLVLLFAWEYWNSPEWFNSLGEGLVADSDNQTTEPQLSSQELAAIGADIDSSSVLLNELDRKTPLSLAPLSNQKPQTQTNVEDLLAQLNPQPANAESKLGRKSSPLIGTPIATPQSRPSDSNPFAVSAQSLLDNGPLGGSGLSNKPEDSRKPFSSVTGFSDDSSSNFKSLNSANPNGGIASANSLSNSWNRGTVNSPLTANPVQPTTDSIQSPTNPQPQALSAPIYQGSVTYSPTTVPGTTGYNTSPIAPTVPPNSYTSTTPSLSPTQPMTGMPLTVPVTPVAPVMPSSYGQYPTQSSSQSSGVINPGLNSTQANPAGLQPSQLSRPNFTVPNAMQRPNSGAQ